jgi:hypothetical protein
MTIPLAPWLSRVCTLDASFATSFSELVVFRFVIPSSLAWSGA